MDRVIHQHFELPLSPLSLFRTLTATRQQEPIRARMVFDGEGWLERERERERERL